MENTDRHLKRRPQQRRNHLLWLLSLFTLCLNIYAPAQNTDSVNAHSFQKALEDHREAFRQGDLAKMKNYLAQDVVFKLPGGKTLTLDGWERLIAISPPRKGVQQENTNEKIEIEKESARVLVKLTESFDASLKKDGSTGKCLVESKRREHWKYNGREWRIQIIELFPIDSMRLNGSKQKDLFEQVITEAPLVASYQHFLSAAERDWLMKGKSLVFVYRAKDTAFALRPPLFLNDQKLAQLVRGSSLELKLEPGSYRLQSEVGGAISVKAEEGKVYYFELLLKNGFPKGRGQLILDKAFMGAQVQVLPTLFDIKPLDERHIYNSSIILK